MSRGIDPTSLTDGDVVGSYVVGRKLGEGATGFVYHAVRESDGLEVALKLLKRALSADSSYVARFKREARIAADVRDRHLVPVVEFGAHGAIVFIAFEYRDGGTLAELVAAEERLPLRDCCRIAGEIAAGLGALTHTASSTATSSPRM